MKINQKDIQYMDERELDHHHRSFKRKIQDLRREKRSAVEVETDVCYVQREIECRQHRRDAHERYVSSLPRRSSR
jgi:hypothetical protein